MKPDIAERVRALADYVIETGGTVRAAGARFGVSKSTVHKDLTERLEPLDRTAWQQVEAILAKNKAERHLRGGAATKAKYISSNK